jgi:hypothetical protein
MGRTEIPRRHATSPSQPHYIPAPGGKFASLALPPLQATPSLTDMQSIAKFRSVLAAFFALSVTFFLTGCFQIEQVIKVKADGSGTMVMSIVVTKEGLTAMRELSKDAPGGAKDPIDDMMNEDKIKEQAGKLGEGVTYVKAEKIKNDVGEGVRMTFKFDDITKVKPSMDTDGGGSGEAAVTFEFTKGDPASLVIKAAHGGDKKPDQAPDDAQFEQAKQFMKGMKMTIAVEVDGEITESDAAHRAGSRVTLAEVPFDEVMKSKDAFMNMSKAANWAERIKVLKEIPGVKVDPKDTITIKFK